MTRGGDISQLTKHGQIYKLTLLILTHETDDEDSMGVHTSTGTLADSRLNTVNKICRFILFFTQKSQIISSISTPESGAHDLILSRPTAEKLIKEG